MSSAPQNPLVHALDKLTATLQSFLTDTVTLQAGQPLLSSTCAFRWRRKKGLLNQATLEAVPNPLLLDFDALQNIERQQKLIEDNTHQFVLGLPANNVLMTGARGTGKSSLVRACLAKFKDQGLRLIEVEKQHLEDLPDIVSLVRDLPYKFVVFCDDLSFDDGEHAYKGLKTVLDGSIMGPSANVLVYATSNRKHLISERMKDNLETSLNEFGEIHPGDTIEEKVSLSERFGLHLHFYSFTQPEYLRAVHHWLAHYGVTTGDNDQATQQLAIRWATQKGSRSGRVAMQFARDLAGKTLLQQHLNSEQN